MNSSKPGLPVHHQLPEPTQTHVYYIKSDAIQKSHPLSYLSSAFNLSQHQGFFQWISSSQQVSRVLEFQLQHQSFQWIFRTDFLNNWLVWFPHLPFSSVQFSRSVMSDSLQPHELQHARPSKLLSIESVMPSSHLILCRPLLLLPPIPPSIRSFPMSPLFAWGGQSTGASALASVLPKNTQGWSPSEGLVGSPCSPRNSQESSPTPQFKSINSSALSFLHSPTLTSIHDYWKNHSLD